MALGDHSPIVYGNPWLTFHEVASTNDVAREWAQAGSPSGTLVSASHQTKGRGRRGRSWDDVGGQSAIMTYIARPALALADVWKLPFVASLAALCAVHDAGVPSARLKWPNDVVSGGKKLAGILVETVYTDKGLAALLGIGINVGQHRFPASGDYVLPPTSIAIESGAEQTDTNGVIEGVSRHLSRLMPLAGGSTADWGIAMTEWLANARFGENQMAATADGEIVTGVVSGVDPLEGSAKMTISGRGQIAVWPR